MNAALAQKMEVNEIDASARKNALEALEGRLRDIQSLERTIGAHRSRDAGHQADARENRKTAEFHAMHAENRPVESAQRTPGKSYDGLLVAQNGNHVIQWDAKRDTYVVHDAKSFASNPAQFQGKDVTIRYPFSGVALVKEKALDLHKGANDRQHVKTESFGDRGR